MSKLNKCPKCKGYTFLEICKECKVRTKKAGHKFKPQRIEMQK